MGLGTVMLNVLRMRLAAENEASLVGRVIRTVQKLPGHLEASTMMIYTQVLNRGGKGVIGPLDRLQFSG